MKKIIIFGFVLMAFVISSNPFIAQASASSTVNTTHKEVAKEGTTPKKSVEKKKAKKVAHKTTKKLESKDKISAPIINPKNPPSSLKPAKM